jgi:hypothetical protein
MARAGYIDNFRDLRNWFMDGNVPKFTIAHGDISSRRYVYQQDEVIDVEEAYEQLEEKLNMFAKNGGTFTVKLPTKNGGNGWTIMFKLPRAEGSAGAGGIGATGAFIGGQGVEHYIAEKISDKMENFELRRKVEDLEAAINGQGSLLERVFNRIAEHPNFDPGALADKLLSTVSGIFTAMAVKNGAGANVGLSGFGGTTGGPDPNTGTPEEMEAMSQRIGMALERIAAVFPEVNIADLMSGLAEYVEKNPEMARMLLVNQILKR